jgi:RNA polymerase sigma-70 factor (ECF subfamily)
MDGQIESTVAEGEPSDSELLSRVYAGDDAAFAVLVNRYTGRLHGFVTSFGVKDVLPEDVLQETFRRAFRRVKKKPFKEKRGGFRGFLFKTAVNVLRTMIKKLIPPSPETEFGADTRADIDNPLENIIEMENKERLNAALLKLPDDERQIIILRDLQGLKWVEICKIVGKPCINAVRYWRDQAIEKLGSLLKERDI